MYKNYRYNELEAKSKEAGIIFDVMVTGVTGAGKSTTLNTFFEKEVAKVGLGADPETMDVASYRLNNSFRLWDTPGLGDGVDKDIIHSKKLIDLLYKTYEMDNRIYGFIDMALVLIEGNSRDLGTTNKLLNEVIVPNFPKEKILVCVNKADFAMKGRHWNKETKQPDSILKEFLEEKVDSIQARVKESTGVEIIRPVYYSGAYNYNVEKLMDLLIDNMPKGKRKLNLDEKVA